MGVDITPLAPGGVTLIQSYGTGRFTIAGEKYTQPLLVFADHVVLWDVTDFSALSLTDFQPLIAQSDQLDIILLGCGSVSQFLPPSLRQALRSHHLIVDVMRSDAACRTHNFLLGEGRRVASALLLI